MDVSDQTRRLLLLCAARIDGRSLDWSLLARTALAGRLDELYEGTVPETEAPATRSRAVPLLQQALGTIGDYHARVETEIEAGATAGAQLITVLDSAYPSNLRAVPDLPPFLFIRGQLEPADSRAVAVVGTRNASEDGLSRAGRMSRELVDRGVTIASGLARGIDTVAHRSAIASGGRTIAVIGTGITRCYPAENRDLAEQVVEHGALLSQFWPTRAPGRDTFPRRNRVTSGISQGTVVIEASSTSGAKMQARLAHEHGKRVWLIQSLVTHQPWAQKMVAEGRARQVSSTSEVLDDLHDSFEAAAEPDRSSTLRGQLALDL